MPLEAWWPSSQGTTADRSPATLGTALLQARDQQAAVFTAVRETPAVVGSAVGQSDFGRADKGAYARKNPRGAGPIFAARGTTDGADTIGNAGKLISVDLAQPGISHPSQGGPERGVHTPAVSTVEI